MSYYCKPYPAKTNTKKSNLVQSFDNYARVRFDDSFIFIQKKLFLFCTFLSYHRIITSTRFYVETLINRSAHRAFGRDAGSKG